MQVGRPAGIAFRGNREGGPDVPEAPAPRSADGETIRTLAAAAGTRGAAAPGPDVRGLPIEKRSFALLSERTSAGMDALRLAEPFLARFDTEAGLRVLVYGGFEQLARAFDDRVAADRKSCPELPARPPLLEDVGSLASFFSDVRGELSGHLVRNGGEKLAGMNEKGFEKLLRKSIARVAQACGAALRQERAESLRGAAPHPAASGFVES